MKGTVKWFNAERGYGFITPDGADPDDRRASVFVHYTGIEGTGYRTLRDGDVVEYETETDGRGRTHAVNVRVLRESARV
jgi:CspA family cold shock protein